MPCELRPTPADSLLNWLHTAMNITCVARRGHNDATGLSRSFAPQQCVVASVCKDASCRAFTMSGFQAHGRAAVRWACFAVCKGHSPVEAMKSYVVLDNRRHAEHIGAAAAAGAVGLQRRAAARACQRRRLRSQPYGESLRCQMGGTPLCFEASCDDRTGLKVTDDGQSALDLGPACNCPPNMNTVQ